MSIVLSLFAVMNLRVEPARAADPASASSSRGEPPKTEKKQLQIASRHVSRLNLQVLNGAEDELSKPLERPLLSYGDPARTSSHGTLWAFGTRGRPDAFLELWQGTDATQVWYQSLIRAGDRKLLLRLSDGRQWRPPEEQLDRRMIENAESPAESRPRRLRQLKALARRFTAHEIGDPDRARFELRLLVQPVHRYDDADHALQDGAAFVFAHGTNPELILLVEAVGATLEEARWRFSALPSSSAELHVALDGREVWLRPGAPDVVGLPTDDYWLFSLPVEENPDDEETADGE